LLLLIAITHSEILSVSELFFFALGGNNCLIRTN
jgi:hypothetical protein